MSPAPTPADAAAHGRPSASDRRPVSVAGLCGRAAITATQPSNGGAVSIIAGRADRLTFNNGVQRSRYMCRHLELARLIYSGARE